MIRRLFVYFTIALTLCFITSCKKDSPTKDNSEIEHNHKKGSNSMKGDDSVIRDDTTVTDTAINNKQSVISADSVKENSEEEINSEITDNSDNRIYDIAEQLPEFPGGLSALNNYIGDKTKELLSSISIKKSLRTMISIIVEKNGSLSNIQVVKSSGESKLDAEASKIVQEMPAWTPAQNNGINVRMKYIVPVIFNPEP